MCLQHVDQVGLEVFGHVVAEYAQTELIRLPLAFDRLLDRLLNQVGVVVGHGHGLQVGGVDFRQGLHGVHGGHCGVVGGVLVVEPVLSAPLVVLQGPLGLLLLLAEHAGEDVLGHECLRVSP